ncbi:hypothetical protein EAH89_06440 [Roseomonas nepalensis]|uniref:Uncharacterized protein n=1 Tax=Muricoccus nepalensis TaxID=1854500 RepID=A0A502GD79_9PROT|nr:hypothetical protein [Roseomonas nepalensis]TPG58996.1 hypothetical protein EAH89_06440 [Roseomonas nepalensis]
MGARVGPGRPEGDEAREGPGWKPGLQPGTGRGSELDEGLKDGEVTDPALRSPLPGFVDQADAVEEAIEGSGVSEARNAVEDLPRQG